MTSLTYNDLKQFNTLGLREICAYNRDCIYNFNILKRHQIVDLLITKSNQGYTISIPKFILNNHKFTKLNFSKSNIKIIKMPLFDIGLIT